MKSDLHTTTRKPKIMRITFLPGGSLNELGPFQAGAEIVVPDAMAIQLIADGLALPIAPISARRITLTINTTSEEQKEITNV